MQGNCRQQINAGWCWVLVLKGQDWSWFSLVQPSNAQEKASNAPLLVVVLPLVVVPPPHKVCATRVEPSGSLLFRGGQFSGRAVHKGWDCRCFFPPSGTKGRCGRPMGVQFYKTRENFFDVFGWMGGGQRMPKIFFFVECSGTGFLFKHRDRPVSWSRLTRLAI